MITQPAAGQNITWNKGRLEIKQINRAVVLHADYKLNIIIPDRLRI